MLRYLLASWALLLFVCANAQTGAQRESILLNASVQVSPPAITLTWTAQSGTTGYTVYRKLKSDNAWGSAIGTAAASATSYQDNGVTSGTYYEYKVVRAYSGGSGYGYIAAGIQVPATDYRGKMVLLVDNTFVTAAATQLSQLEADLKGDGWIVLRNNVDRSASVSAVRAIIQGHYNADPTNVKAVYIIGHLAVPYSGNLNPDGHGDHQGAWPCDGYYGEMNGTWSDNSVNNSGSQNNRNHNTPGDGKFDHSDYPSGIELQVGRIDFYEFESFQYYAGLSETQLTINYLNKAHQFKAKLFTPTFRGAVFNNFDDLSYALAGSGYKSIAPLVGNANFNDLNPNGAPFSTYVDDQSYLWTYACGGGSWSTCDNVGSTGEYANNIAMGGVFNMTFGSYFGDWNTYNNFLKAPLGSGRGLTNVWAGIPNWWFHHMGMGDNIGYSTLVTMNNTNLYVPQNPGWQGNPYSRVHLGLMGDPSLRQVMVPMPSALQVSNNGGLASFNWTAAAGVDGYYLYDMGAAGGIPQRITPSLVTSTSFSSPTVPFIAGREYMVRAVELEISPTGSFYNLSLGALATASGQAAPDCLGVVGGAATVGSACNDNNACTVSDVYNASCQCAGTTSPDSDGDGICNAQDNCPNVSGRIGSSCNDGNACTTNDVLNANCQCAGTTSPDSDGDGTCNAQDNCPNVAGRIGSSCNDGNACTTNDVLNANCQCAGTTSPDSDGDGICNAQDNCPNVSGQIGSSCNDGNACTTNDVLNANCQCAGTISPDSDGDGICNAQDNCPNVAGQVGSSCNDGNACTTNDVLNANCQCAGTTSPDSDGDGICNAQDNCPNVSGQIGSSCNDGNACTTNDVLNANCQCAGTTSPDSDGDGICNAQDNCPNVAGRIGSSCNDGNACTTNDVLNASCQCAGTTSPDSDGDGICNAQDNCPNAPGQIGSSCNDGNACTTNDVLNANCQCAGTISPDSDGDGICNAQDNCPNAAGQIGSSCDDGNGATINDVLNANCVCAGTAQPIDCNGVVNGSAVVDACGVCAGGNTGVVPNSSCLDCLGVPNGSALPGTSCNDNDANTINDVLNANCVCAGTAQPIDCNGVVNGSAVVDACGVCAGGNTGVVPNSSCLDCLGVPNGSALPGTSCNDNNANTINDVFNANCVCAGTAQPIDCNGVVNGTAAVDACGVCAGGNTGVVPNSSCLDCLGVPNGSALPGTSCNDNDASTINDVFNANCVCAGTAQPIDCNGVVNGTAAVDACGVCAGGNTGVVPNSSCLDCLGVPNGSALPGTSCNDNNANTINDVFNANCVCAGTAQPIDCNGVVNGTAAVDACGVCAGGNTGVVPNSSCLDCLGVPNGSALPGTSCNDNDASTINDVFNANCVCAGTAQPIDCNGVVNGTAAVDACGVCAGGNTGVVPNSSCLDCLGVPNGSALPGTSCNDNNANTINDVFNANCVCAGTAQPIDCNGVVNGTAAMDACGVCAGGNTGVVPNSSCLDCLGVPNGSALPGTSCNDNNANTTNDVFSANCVCAGTAQPIDCNGVVNGSAAVDACGVCAGGNTGVVPNSSCLDCLGVPNGSALPGTSCNDNDASTINDVFNANCVCAGTAQPIDCNGVVNGTAAVDACGVCAGGNTGVVPNSSCLDCLGVPNGSALPGTSCNDNNANTINDVFNANCVCAGTAQPIDCNGVVNGSAVVDACGVCAGGNTGVVPNSSCLDCLGVPNGSALPGTSCNDNNANTTNDVFSANCVCAGTAQPIDCNGVVNGSAAVDACGVCAGGTTGVIPNSSCLDCLGVPNGSALPGTSCNDNNANTINDVLNANCVCAGTAQPIDCNGVVNGTAAMDACGVCAGGNTGVVPNSSCLDCLGVPNGSALPGTSCNDNNANTTNDVFSANCVCAGTAQQIDCNGVVNGSAAVDACGVCAGGTTGVIPNSSCLDCLGVPNGSALPGSSCNDNNANTVNDVFSAGCVCAGTAQPIDCNGVVNGTAAVDACGVCAGGNTGVVPNSSCLDCLGVPNGSAVPGTSCNDNNANTINDVLNANCVCAGTGQPIDCNGVVNGTAAVDACGVCAGGNTGVVPNSSCLDCLGVPNGSALPGTSCNDNDASTGNDEWTSNCTCVGESYDCLGIPGGTATIGSPCNDGNSSTMNDVYDTDCVCGGATFLIDCTGTLNGSAMPGTHCDDGDPFTGNDTWTIGCFCAGQLLDCTGTPGGTAMPGTPCDDQDPTTGNDTWNSNCGCVGQPIDCSGIVGGAAWPGTPCDDQIPDNGADVWTLNCECVGNGAVEDCNGVQGGQALPGTPCDDGNNATGNDTWSLTCGCAGVPIDCAGVIGGEASIDACGQCAGGTTGVVPNADTDSDGLLDCDDSCPGIFNPEQNDYDGDGVGDGCDNCAWLANSDQSDTNGNGIGDACEVVGVNAASDPVNFSIWPNPTGGRIVITDGSNRIRMVRYHDLSGKLIFEMPFAPQADLTGLATGTYIVIALDVEGRPLARTRLVKH